MSLLRARSLAGRGVENKVRQDKQYNFFILFVRVQNFIAPSLTLREKRQGYGKGIRSHVSIPSQELCRTWR